MSVSVELKKLTDNEIRFVVYDEDRHSLPNLIVKAALRRKEVVYAAYMLKHPLTSYPEVIIITDGSRKPIEILEEVLSEARATLRELAIKFEEALRGATKKGE